MMQQFKGRRKKSNKPRQRFTERECVREFCRLLQNAVPHAEIEIDQDSPARLFKSPRDFFIIVQSSAGRLVSNFIEAKKSFINPLAVPSKKLTKYQKDYAAAIAIKGLGWHGIEFFEPKNTQNIKDIKWRFFSLTYASAYWCNLDSWGVEFCCLDILF